MPAMSRGSIVPTTGPAASLQTSYLAGNYYGPGVSHTVSTGAAGLNVQTFMPFYVGAPFTCDKIGVEATATAATAVARLGIYASDGTAQKPATLLAAAAATVDISAASGSDGVITDLAYTFSPGLYFLSAVSQTASGTLRCIASTNGMPTISAAAGATPFGAVALSGWYKTGISGALANVATPTPGGAMYLVKVRAA